MKTRSIAVLAALIACAAGEARASEPAAPRAVAKTLESRPTGPLSRATNQISLAELPQGQLLEQSWQGRPSALPAGGKVDGVKIERVVQHSGTRSHVVIKITDPDIVQDGTVSREDMNLSARCMDTADQDYRGERLEQQKKNKEQPDADEDDNRPNERWSAGMNWEGQMRRSERGEGAPRNDRVQQLHVEELVPTPQGLALDSRDVWVDASTGGARVRATAHLPLRDLGLSPIGVHLYAARAGEQVIFVARQTKGTSSVFAGRKDETTQSMSCGHITMRLDVKRGMSEMGMFQTIARMPGEDEQRAAEDKAKAEEPRIPDDTSGSGRTRLGRMIVSSTWEQGDPGPLVSFSSGWADRPRNE